MPDGVEVGSQFQVSEDQRLKVIKIEGDIATIVLEQCLPSSDSEAPNKWKSAAFPEDDMDATAEAMAAQLAELEAELEDDPKTEAGERAMIGWFRMLARVMSVVGSGPAPPAGPAAAEEEAEEAQQCESPSARAQRMRDYWGPTGGPTPAKPSICASPTDDEEAAQFEARLRAQGCGPTDAEEAEQFEAQLRAQGCDPSEEDPHTEKGHAHICLGEMMEESVSWIDVESDDDRHSPKAADCLAAAMEAEEDVTPIRGMADVQRQQNVPLVSGMKKCLSF